MKVRTLSATRRQLDERRLFAAVLVSARPAAPEVEAAEVAATKQKALAQLHKVQARRWVRETIGR